jgi:hypothetical protein
MFMRKLVSIDKNNDSHVVYSAYPAATLVACRILLVFLCVKACASHTKTIIKISAFKLETMVI